MATVEARISINTNPMVTGRYAIDVRDNADRQLKMKITDNPAAFMMELTKAGLTAGVLVEMVDNTGE